MDQSEFFLVILQIFVSVTIVGGLVVKGVRWIDGKFEANFEAKVASVLVALKEQTEEISSRTEELLPNGGNSIKDETAQILAMSKTAVDTADLAAKKAETAVITAATVAERAEEAAKCVRENSEKMNGFIVEHKDDHKRLILFIKDMERGL